jgi:hypothetical protein
MIWIAGRSPTLVSHSLRGVATNLKATTLTYLAILRQPPHLVIEVATTTLSDDLGRKRLLYERLGV